MITITATEFKKNLGSYLEKAENEIFLITKNDKVIAKLTNPDEKQHLKVSDFFGCLSNNVTEQKD